MPADTSPVMLQVQPSALPAVRASIEESLTDLQVQLMHLYNGAFIPEPWMGDPISENVRVFYNTAVIESADGPMAALLAYQSELTRIRDTLKTMEDNYRRTEGDNAALWGRQG